jgi:hypothetical protein
MIDTIRKDLEIITLQKPPPAGENYADALKRLDALNERQDLPERLEHYLSKRSYLKALAWLDNPNMPHHP